MERKRACPSAFVARRSPALFTRSGDPATVRQRMKGGNMLGALGMLAAKSGGNTDTILWVIAAVLVIAGIVTLIRGSVLLGIVLIVVGLLVGPGGVSIFD